MKTAISIPDDLFDSAEKLAEEQGISRSRLYALAVEAYLEQQRGEKVMERLNAYYASEKAEVNPVLKKAQAKSLRKKTHGDVW